MLSYTMYNMVYLQFTFGNFKVYLRAKVDHDCKLIDELSIN